jgi:hypothetical protein
LISGHESKKGLEIDPHLSLDVVKQAYPEAVQSVSIDRTPNNAGDHRPVRVLVPLWEVNLFAPEPFWTSIGI